MTVLTAYDLKPSMITSVTLIVVYVRRNGTLGCVAMFVVDLWTCPPSPFPFKGRDLLFPSKNTWLFC